MYLKTCAQDQKLRCVACAHARLGLTVLAIDIEVEDTAVLIRVRDYRSAVDLNGRSCLPEESDAVEALDIGIVKSPVNCLGIIHNEHLAFFAVTSAVGDLAVGEGHLREHVIRLVTVKYALEVFEKT